MFNSFLLYTLEKALDQVNGGWPRSKDYCISQNGGYGKVEQLV